MTTINKTDRQGTSRGDVVLPRPWGKSRRRRGALGIVFRFMAAVGLVLWFDGPALAEPSTRDLSFQVMADGMTIGHHRIRFRQEGRDLHALIQVDLAVSLGPLTLFSLRHRSHEIWREGRLIALETTTDDDGEDFWVSGRATPQGFWIESNRGSHLAPPEAMPASYWHRGSLDSPTLIDTQDGTVIANRTEFLAREPLLRDGRWIETLRYRRHDDYGLELWYDAEGVLSQTRFTARGSEIESRWAEGATPVYQAKNSAPRTAEPGR